jgi:hypothetical protein
MFRVLVTSKEFGCTAIKIDNPMKRINNNRRIYLRAFIFSMI